MFFALKSADVHIWRDPSLLVRKMFALDKPPYPLITDVLYGQSLSTKFLVILPQPSVVYRLKN